MWKQFINISISKFVVKYVYIVLKVLKIEKINRKEARDGKFLNILQMCLKHLQRAVCWISWQRLGGREIAPSWLCREFKSH